MQHKKNNKNEDIEVSAFDHAELIWRAPEFPHHAKSKVWYIGAGIIAALLVWYGIATESWTFSVAVLVLCGTYYLVNRELPEEVDVTISRVGLRVGRHKIPFGHLKSFWLAYDPPYVKKLYLRMSGKFQPDLAVELHEANPTEVRTALKKYLKEISGQSEPMSDMFIRLLRL